MMGKQKGTLKKKELEESHRHNKSDKKTQHEGNSEVMNIALGPIKGHNTTRTCRRSAEQAQVDPVPYHGVQGGPDANKVRFHSCSCHE